MVGAQHTVQEGVYILGITFGVQKFSKQPNFSAYAPPVKYIEGCTLDILAWRHTCCKGGVALKVRVGCGSYRVFQHNAKVAEQMF
jgi:hypothetical protein